MNKKIHIIGGGTVSHIRTHFAVCSPAYGATARKIAQIMASDERFKPFDINLHLTKMADHTSHLETNKDIEELVYKVKKDLSSKIIIFNPAIIDFEPRMVGLGEDRFNTGKKQTRLESRNYNQLPVIFEPARKIIPEIRNGRKDIFLVGFKTTCNLSEQEMYIKGLDLVKTGSCNLVLVNDIITRVNMIVTPEEAAYHVTQNREEALINLVDITYLRSHLTFTQSTVVSGKLVPWDSPLVPQTLRLVVDYCVNGNAYKPFNGATVGHFAVKLSDNRFLTSIRRSNFNDLDKVGLVEIQTDGPDTVIAFGAKPSVGGQSQRIVFKDHPGLDCIVHFHSPLKTSPRDSIPIKSQREYECGSHQCGKNTSDGLKQFGNIWAVYLEQHGPNIVFNKDTNPQEIIDFINANFELDKKTGGYTL